MTEHLHGKGETGQGNTPGSQRGRRGDERNGGRLLTGESELPTDDCLVVQHQQQPVIIPVERVD
jgi:hypothetical protein